MYENCGCGRSRRSAQRRTGRSGRTRRDRGWRRRPARRRRRAAPSARRSLPAFTEPPYWMRTDVGRVGAASSRDARRGSPRTPPARRRPSRCGRCRSPRSARRRSPSTPTCSARAAGEPGADLAEHLRLGLAGLALVERLADAHDRRHPVLLDRGDLAWRPSRRSRRTARAARCARRSRTATSSLARNSGDTSPVNAPLSSQWQCCAPSANVELVGLDHGLHAADVGERRVDADVDVDERRPCRRGTTASGRSGSPRSGCGSSSSCRR